MTNLQATPGQLAGKVVAITGASRGIGRVVAGALVRQGAGVVLLARESTALREAEAELGVRATAIPVDVGNPDEVRAAFAAIDERFGRLDALINNAGVAWPHRIEEVSDEELTREVSTNVIGPVLTVRSAIPLLRRSELADIVNVSSEVVMDPYPFLLIYASSKAWLEMLSTGLLRELRPDGIRVSVLRVGRTVGEFTAHWGPRLEAAEKVWDEGGYRARLSGTVPQPAEQVAEAVLYLLTRPVGSIVDVMHARSFPPPGATPVSSAEAVARTGRTG
jgi:NAD(P)-dependent dehydrogenase (short-subunit alcohol dehydrogenase family)